MSSGRTWKTADLEAVDYQMAIFSIEGIERFMVEVTRISSGNLFGGDAQRRRVLSVTKAGEVMMTLWRPFHRIDERG